MSVLWTAQELVDGSGGRMDTPFDAKGISIDSRSVAPGDLFVALEAARDGHDFVAKALKAGAAGALVSKVPEGVSEDAPLLIVDDTFEGLERLGRARRAATNARVVAITGSVGKTSTKEMLRLALAPFGSVHAAEKSFNNHWGVPLTLARMPKGAAFAVIEIGMNRPHEIAPLAQMAKPDVALITTVGLAHVEAFEGIEGIAQEKGAIFEGLSASGTAIFHDDMDRKALAIVEGLAWQSAATSLRFGRRGSAQYRLLDQRIHSDHLVATCATPDEVLGFSLQTTAPHFAVNAVAVVSVVGALGLDVGTAVEALNAWAPPAGRGTRHQINGPDGTFALIDDAYNANPASMSAALDVLAVAEPSKSGVRVAVLGDMLELGTRTEEFHKAIADLSAMKSIAKVHCVGPLMRMLWSTLAEDKRGQWANTPNDLDIDAIARAGDVVLVKGSNGSGVARVADALKALGER